MNPLKGMYEADGLDKNEILFSRYGAIKLAQKQTASRRSVLTPANKQKAELSFSNVVYIPVLEGLPLSIGTTRSCTIADQESTSAEIALSFTPYAFGFGMYTDQYAVGNQPMNYIQFQNDWLHKMDQYTLAWMAAVDTATRNIIEAARNTFWPTNIPASYFPVTGNALQISQAQQDDAFNMLASVMFELDFYGMSDVLGSTSLATLTKRLEAQGAGNATNEEFQFKLGAFSFTSSNRVTSAAGVKHTGYLIQDGQLAVFNRNNPSAIANRVIGGPTNPAKEWGTAAYPLLDMTVGTYYTADCASNANVGGGTTTDAATFREGFAFDTEIGWLTAYNSSPSTKQTGIVKFEISQS